MQRRQPNIEPAVRVSTLELFFDLVFVFTVTQVTGLLADDLTQLGVLRAAVLLTVILWMYAGYAWLTNAVAPTSSLRRGLLVMGMGGFLTMALAVPDAYVATGLAFGLGYFVVNAIHTGLFLHSGGPGAVRAMARLAPLNLLTATMVLVGGVLPAQWRLPMWGLTVVVQWVSPYLHPMTWTISPAHFVERHGLVVIVALGESIVAIGVGAAGLPVDAGLITVAALGLALAYLLWWTYFGGDDEAAERALASLPPERQPRVALRSYGFAHVPILFGIVVLAAGVKKAVGHAFDHLTVPQALALGGGVALFLVGDVLFRRELSIGVLRFRSVGAVGALATVPLGPWLATAQLVALLVVLVLMLASEDRSRGISWVRGTAGRTAPAG
ncbi:MAG TPA: low temperature requirement protein A [Pseudonocardiaceae bacterium]